VRLNVLERMIVAGLQRGPATALSREGTKRTTKNSIQDYEARQNSDWLTSFPPFRSPYGN
jgi:hypothetical protein